MQSPNLNLKFKKIINFILKHKELFIILAILIISGAAHGYNMFGFPYYENDEGTYMSQAWSLLTQGKLAPYTYWYDHAPAGWILIALWAKLTGGFFTFGTSIDSGRVLMLLLHLGTTYLLFYATKKLSGSLFAGIIAALIFSLSPLGIYFQRRVLLDNIMIFWVFLSLAPLLKDKLKLKFKHIVMSAIFFGIAVLTKENAIFFIPVFLYVIYNNFCPEFRKFAFVNWIVLFGMVVSSYFLYAFLKGEFFPVGFWGDNISHVSLISTLWEQFSRGDGLRFWDVNGEFYFNLMKWMARDSLIIVIGAIAVLINAIISVKNKSFRIPALFAAMFLMFLMRGKLVIDFYIIPLIPLLALNIGMLIDFIARKITFGRKLAYYLLAAIITCSTIFVFLSNPIGQYTRDETVSQRKAVNWIKENISEDTYIIIDQYAYVDFHEARFDGDKVFNNADWFWKLYNDPQVRDDKFENDWRKIEYIALSHEMLKQIKVGTQDFLKKAFDNSYLIAGWKENSVAYIDIDNYISTNGDWMSVYKINDDYSIVLDNSWEFYKDNFIISYGQVIDPHNNNLTTSEGQSYAMLRSVWQNDRDTFDGVWAWTKDHMQFRAKDKLFSWLWTKENGEYMLKDSSAASDADQDIALALLFAYKRWGDPVYLTQAKEIINDIWINEVVEIQGKHYLTAGTWAPEKENVVINPSYFAPYAYRIFAEVDPTHSWMELADSSYDVLFCSSQSSLGYDKSVGLPPNWCAITPNGEIVITESLGNFSHDYSHDAFRTVWRIALDWQWNKDPRAKEYLESLDFLNKEWAEKKKISASYSHDGKYWENYESTASYGANLGYFIVVHPETSKEIYEEKILGKYFEDDEKSYWNDPKNYYEQNWAWFGTALYADKLPNFWNQIKQ